MERQAAVCMSENFLASLAAESKSRALWYTSYHHRAQQQLSGKEAVT